MHQPGLVVIARDRYTTQQPLRRRGKRRAPQWTLHKADCPYVKRENSRPPLPAPIKAYPGTVACKTCKPPTATQETPHAQR